MTEYAIKAYPTEYRGRTYRSRLEARWAAFFDLLGWKHEYEPFDLGKWSPDFLLTDMNALVEVKPITSVCEDTCNKMVAACAERSLIPGAEYNNKINSLILLGVSPTIPASPLACPTSRLACGVMIGWIAIRTYFFGVWDDASIGWWLSSLPKTSLRSEIIHADDDGWYSANGWKGHYEFQDSPIGPFSNYSATMELWAKATSIVQWRPE